MNSCRERPIVRHSAGRGMAGHRRVRHGLAGHGLTTADTAPLASPPAGRYRFRSMGDLDQLAQAAATNERYQLAAEPYRRRQRARSAWLAVGVGLLVLVGLGVVAGKWTGVLPSERKFSIRQGDYRNAIRWWEVTNESDDPLRVFKVTVNGEFVCPPADVWPDNATPSSRPYPVDLTIGQTGGFLQHFSNGTESMDWLGVKVAPHPEYPRYAKAAVYVDFATNRGTHRYRVGQGWE